MPQLGEIYAQQGFFSPVSAISETEAKELRQDYEAAERELNEELGLNGVVLEEIFRLEASVYTGYEFVNVFLCRDDSTISPDAEEIIAWRWCSSDELQSWMEKHPDIFTSVFKTIVTYLLETKVL